MQKIIRITIIILLVLPGATFVPAGYATAGSGPIIDVWYGSDQYFGHIGIPQVWVNILGKVTDPDGVQSLAYSLNSGPYNQLSIAPTNKRRIYNPGDFNVEIAIDDLINGLNTISLRAVDSLSNETVEQINVHYDSTKYWPETFSVDWSTISSIQDAVQVVDGLWTLEADNIRPVEQGYDRLVAIGDILWEDYEVTVPITIHGIDSKGYESPSNGPAVGLVLRWQGHYARDSSQPSWGYYPLGSIGYYRLRAPEGTGPTRIELLGNDANWLDGVSRFLDFETTYIFKMRVETPEGQAAIYSLKVWEQGAAEPPTWDLSAQETLPDFESGSVLLLAHHVDASFGDVSIVSLSGTDTTSPQISNISSVPQETTATITWTTDEPASSEVLYGLTTGYEVGAVQDASLVTSHSVVLTGLSPDTFYNFVVASADEAGNSSSPGNHTFLTLSPDNIPPSITNIQVLPGATGATVTWTTDEASNSRVDYGLTSAYGDGFVEDSVLVTFHSISLMGLTPASTYHYQITSADGSGNSASSADLTFNTLIIPSDPSGIVSDDFSSPGLNTNLWTFTNPLGVAYLSMTGSQAAISLPQGLSHDPWTSNNAARIMQPCNDTDFEVEVKFESEVLERYQMQGIMVGQDNGNYLRFDIYSAGSSVRAFAGRITDNSPSGIYNRLVGSSTPLYQRVRRQGTTWTHSYSYDGTTWTTAGNFTDSLTPAEIGPYIGNYYPGDKAPAFTGIVDYFFNTASPIVPEDPSVGQYVLTTQMLGSGTVTQVPNKMFYLAGEVVELSAVSDAGWIFSGWEGDLSGNQNPAQLVIMSDHTVTAVFNVEEDTILPTITNIQVSPGATGATVTWTTDETSTSRVDYGLTSVYGDGFVEDSVLVTFHSISLTGLTPASTYHYQVTSTDGSGNSASSADLTFTTLDTIPPAAVTFFTASDDEPGQITLAWTNPGDGDLDQVLTIRKVGSLPVDHTDGTVVFQDTSPSPGGMENVVDSNIDVGTAYNYAVFTKDTSGNWNDSVIPGQNADTGISPDLTPPSISNIQVLPGTTGATVTWTTDEASSSRVDYGPTSSYEDGFVEDGALTTSHSISLTGLSPDSTYHYQVTSTDGSGNSASSADLTFTTLDTIPPAAVTFFTASDDEPGQITLAWTNPGDGDLDQVIVTRKSGSLPVDHTDGTVVFQDTSPSPGGMENVVDSNIDVGTAYNYAVFTKDTSGNWNDSVILEQNADTGVSPDLTPPSITNIQVLPGATGATVTWTTDEASTSRVDYGLTSAYGDGFVEDGTPVTSHSITLDGLTPDTTYYYQVTSTDGSGNSASSVDLTFATLIISSDPSGIVSDNFNNSILNTNRWTFTDPLGLADLSMTGNQVVISLPQGLSHDPWTSNDAARIMQPCNDADFEVEVKFESEVLERYQMQGIMVQQDNGNYLRFDVYSTGSSIRAFAGRITNNSPRGIYSKSLGSTTPPYQRVQRQGSTWTHSYSYDGISWIMAGSFTDGLTATEIGPYIGNYYPGDKAPTFTGIVDYFFNTASPIVL